MLFWAQRYQILYQDRDDNIQFQQFPKLIVPNQNMKISYPTQFLHRQNLSVEKKTISTAHEDPNFLDFKKRIHPNQHQKDKLIKDLTIKIAKLKQSHYQEIKYHKDLIYDLMKKNNFLEEKINFCQSQDISNSQLKQFLKNKLELIWKSLQNGHINQTKIDEYSLSKLIEKFDQSVQKIIQDNRLIRNSVIPSYKNQILQFKQKIYQLNGCIAKLNTDNLGDIQNKDHNIRLLKSISERKLRQQIDNIKGDRQKIKYYHQICEIFGVRITDQHVHRHLLDKIKELKYDFKVLVNEIKKIDDRLKISKEKSIELKNENISLKNELIQAKAKISRLEKLLNSYNQQIVKGALIKLNKDFENYCN